MFLDVSIFLDWQDSEKTINFSARSKSKMMGIWHHLPVISRVPMEQTESRWQALARTVLEDTVRFFWDLDQCAKCEAQSLISLIISCHGIS